jgi:DNA-3-methyladenine glycosylase I
MRDAFDGFDPEKVAAYGEADIARLLGDARIIRSRAKINSAIKGARIWLEMRDQGEDFSEWLWSFVGGAPIQNHWPDSGDRPVATPESEAMAKALKKRGFTFCGPVIVYAFMQAVGMVNDHGVECFRHRQVRAMADR